MIELEAPEPADRIYAGFWIRTLAAAMDTALLGTVMAAVMVGRAAAGGSLESSPLISWTLPVLYTVGFWQARQATPGKLLCGLKVVAAEGLGHPGLGRLLGRYAAYYASMLPLGLGCFWVALDPRRQGWHDKLAGTAVVHDPDAGDRRRAVMGAVLLAAAAFAAALAAGAVWLKRNGPELRVRGSAIRREAEEFGKERGSAACLQESLARDGRAKDILGHVDGYGFLDVCLRSAEPDPALCEGYAAGRLLEAVGWSAEQCAKRGRRDVFCRKLFQRVWRDCQRRVGAAR